MLERLEPHRRNLALGVLGLLVLWFSWTVRAVLNPLLLGYLLAYIVHPLVVNLERSGWKRRTAVNAIFASAGLVTLVLVAGLFYQGRGLALRLAESDVFLVAEERLERLGEEARSWLGEEGEPTDQHGGEGEAQSPPELSEEAPSAVELEGAPDAEEPAAVGWGQVLSDYWRSLSAEQSTRSAAGRAALQGTGWIWQLLSAWFGSLLAFGTLVVLLPVYTYFLLFELGRIHSFVQRYLPVRDRERLSRVAGELGMVLASFFRGRLMVCLLKGAFLSLGLVLLGVDYALLIGMGSGFLALVPFVGPAIGFLGALLIGLLDMEPLGLVVRLSVVFVLSELLEGYVLLPRVLGDSLGLHPVVVLASMMVGGAALGVFGVLAALPLTAGLVILTKEFVLPALEDFADEGAEELPGGGELSEGGAGGNPPVSE